jgi:Chaperone of endosialidase/Head domain of trimeric autotransporter adhesin
MKKIFILLLILFAATKIDAQNVGIGTTNPIARLHVSDSNVVFTGPSTITATNFSPPVQGSGSRMMWYPQKAAFRVGYVDAGQWNKDNIGYFSFATGYNSIAAGDAAFSAGVGTVASGYQSIAMGYLAYATGYHSVSMGSNTSASGASTTAMGNGTTASGDYSTSAGVGSTASGFGSTTFGHSTTASALASTAMGYRTIARSLYSLVIGSYNDTSSSGSLFEIGNGISDGSRRNAMTVLSNGNVGIGKPNPSMKLEIFVSGSGSFYHPQTSLGIEQNSSHYINLITNNSSETGILFGNNISGSDGGITYRATNVPDPQALYFRAASITRMAVYNNSNVWIGGSLIQASDARLKKNITPLSGTLSSLQQLNGYTYNWKDEKRDSTLQIGLIAQEVQKIYPQLVKQKADGELSLNYIGLIPVLLEGMKEQQKEIEELKQEMKKLQNK